MKRKLGLYALIASTLLGSGIITNAAERDYTDALTLQETVSCLEKGYSEYYNILDTDTTLCSSHNVNGNVENIYLLEMQAVLKAGSVEEMDYYQGVAAYSETMAVDIGGFRSEENLLHANALMSEKEEIYNSLKQYIGKEQSLVFYIKETFPIDNKAQTQILFENGLDYVSWEEMLPASHKELQETGYIQMANFDSEYMVQASDVKVQQATVSYSVDDAVKYMTTYTSNPTSCNVCGGTCTSKVDTTKYNSSYSHYVSKGSHKDCANYVSQALYAGGIPTDSTWKAGSSAWIGVSALTKHMTSQNYWSSISYDQVQKGDIVSYTSYSHVVMITDFDGTTYKFSGHTNDRKNVTISIKKSNASSYNFYRVG